MLFSPFSFISRYVRTDVVHVMPPQVRSKVLAYLFEEKELLESLPTVQLVRNDEIICFYQFRKILINLNSSCIAHTVRLNMKKGWKNELDLRPWILASVDLSGQDVYGQQNHKTPNWQKNSKIREICWKMGFCSLLWQMGLEESLGIIYIHCRAWQYRLIDVEILKIQPLFQEL